jgi:hypothetical protein
MSGAAPVLLHTECMESHAWVMAWVLSSLVLGCGASSDGVLFGGRQGASPEAAATGGTPSFGGMIASHLPDAGPPGSGGMTGAGGSADNRDAAGAPDASGGFGGTDAGPPCTSKRFYLDEDGDGFGDAKHPVDACTMPPHYVTNSTDCYDGNVNAHPGQAASFDGERGDGSFDYDCNGVGTPDATVIGKCGSVPFCSGSPGWKASAPECGKSGTWLATCTGLTTICGQTMETRIQKCK